MDSKIYCNIWSRSSWHWARGRVHPGQVASQSQVDKYLSINEKLKKLRLRRKEMFSALRIMMMTVESFAILAIHVLSKCFSAIQKLCKKKKNLSLQLDVVKTFWGELDYNDVWVQFSHEWRKQEHQTGEVLEEIKWKQNRNWLRCWGNEILRSSPGSLRV